MLVNLLVERKLTLTRSLLEGHKTSQHHVYFFSTTKWDIGCEASSLDIAIIEKGVITWHSYFYHVTIYSNQRTKKAMMKSGKE